MKFDQLRYLLEIADTASFHAAAKNLFLAQPALRASIRQVEAKPGCPVFVRSFKGVRLARNGCAILRHARAILDEYERMLRVARARNAVKEISISFLSLLGSPGDIVLTPGVMHYAEEHDIPLSVPAGAAILCRRGQEHRPPLFTSAAGLWTEVPDMKVDAADRGWKMAQPAQTPVSGLFQPHGARSGAGGTAYVSDVAGMTYAYAVWFEKALCFSRFLAGIRERIPCAHLTQP